MGGEREREREREREKKIEVFLGVIEGMCKSSNKTERIRGSLNYHPLLILLPHNVYTLAQTHDDTNQFFTI